MDSPQPQTPSTRAKNRAKNSNNHLDQQASLTAISAEQARWLYRYHRSLQRERLRAEAQLRSLKKLADPAPLQALLAGHRTQEQEVRRALERYVSVQPAGRWLLSIRGIGPMLAAGLLVYLNVARAKSHRSFWRYAGLTPDSVYRKGQRNGWCRSLRTICYQIGECLIRARNHELASYGRLYDYYKGRELARNSAGEYLAIAKSIVVTGASTASLMAKRWHDQGMLTPSHTHARARRKMVQDLLVDLYVVLHYTTFGDVPKSVRPTPLLEPIQARILALRPAAC